MSREFSFTQLQPFDHCPRRYKFRYVERTPVPRRLSPELVLGQVVHKVLQKLYESGADGVLAPKDLMLEMYQAEWDRYDPATICLSKQLYTIDDYQRLGREMLERHYDRYQPFRQGDLLGTEARLRCQLPNSGFVLRGDIDRFWKREDGVVEICDYKTGHNIPQRNDPSYILQMGIYQLLLEANFPQFKKIELAQHFLRRDEIVRCELSDEELDQLREQLRALMWRIDDSVRLDDFPTNEGPLCDYCDYRLLCPAKRHQVLLEGEDTAGEATPVDAEACRRLADRYIELYDQGKEIELGLEALKEEFKHLVRTLNLTTFEGNRGQVKVAVRHEEKFITKSDDDRKFAQLSQLARQLGLEEFFKLEGRALMKEAYALRRLTPAQMESLEPFVVAAESWRTSVKRTSDNSGDDT